MGFFSGLLSGGMKLLGNVLGGAAKNVSENAGSYAAAGLGYKGVQDTNKANLEIAQMNSAFNANEAAKNRDYQAQQAAQARDFNAQQTADQMAFQERMSNTQYQRAVGDMEAAGLNPMLAYSQGGAGNVSGASASSPSPSGGQASAASTPAMMDKLGPMLNAAQRFHEVQNIKSTNKQIDAQTGLLQAQTGQAIANTAGVNATMEETLNRIPVLQAQVKALSQETSQKGELFQIDKLIRELDHKIRTHEVTTAEAHALISKVQHYIAQQAQPEAYRRGREWSKLTDDEVKKLIQAPGEGTSAQWFNSAIQALDTFGDWMRRPRPPYRR